MSRDTNKSRFQLNSIPYHVHNGIDSPKINEDNVVLTKKLLGFLILDSSETFTLAGVENVSRISFHGFAANNADGSPATLRALITGEVVFGKCYQPIGAGETISVSTFGNSLPFMQGCNYVYLDSTDATNTRVGVAQTSVELEDVGNLAYASGTTPEVLASLSLVSYDGANLRFNSTLASNWKLQGNIIIE